MRVDGKEVKTIDGWNEYVAKKVEEFKDRQMPIGATDFRTYCKPRDLVGEDVFDFFINILPPRTCTGYMLQVGEPYDSRKNPNTGRFENTYETFTKHSRSEYGLIYEYHGDCFAGGTERGL